MFWSNGKANILKLIIPCIWKNDISFCQMKQLFTNLCKVFFPKIIQNEQYFISQEGSNSNAWGLRSTNFKKKPECCILMLRETSIVLSCNTFIGVLLFFIRELFNSSWWFPVYIFLYFWINLYFILGQNVSFKNDLLLFLNITDT